MKEAKKIEKELLRRQEVNRKRLELPFHIGSREGFNCSHIIVRDGENSILDTNVATVYGIHNQCDREDLDQTEGAPIIKRIVEEHNALLGIKNPADMVKSWRECLSLLREARPYIRDFSELARKIDAALKV